MSEFKAKADKIKAYNEKQRQRINDEEIANGGFDKWYDSLEGFRNDIKKKYIRINLFNKCYRHKVIKTESGHIIDHHIISYLAPMEFTRVGWNNNRLSPCEHLKKISDYFTGRGKRFIYCAIPNKGCIYPNIICNNPEIFEGGAARNNSPQWRYYIRKVIEAGVEVIDMYPIFCEKKDQYDLFSKEHHISALGAKVIGKTIAEYLRSTTEGIGNNFDIFHDTYEIYLNDFYEPEQCKELCDIYYVKDEKNKDIKQCYRNIGQDNSKICLFGDCNLQSYNSIGGGITNNTTYYLKHPIVDEGRKLVFGYEEKPLMSEDLKELEKYDIIVYVAFASAPFVRSSNLFLRKPKMEYKWQHLDI